MTRLVFCFFIALGSLFAQEQGALRDSGALGAGPESETPVTWARTARPSAADPGAPEALSRGAEPWRAATKLSAIELKENLLTIKTQGEHPRYKAFSVAQPPKIVLELYDTWVPQGFTPEIQTDAVRKVRVAQFSSAPEAIARIVIDLNTLTGYKISKYDGTLAVRFGTPDEKETSEEKPRDSAKAAGQASAPVKEEKIDILKNLPKTPIDVNFQKTDAHAALGLLISKLESLMNMKVNLITADDVSGTVTLKFESAPFDEVWNAVLSMTQLMATQTGSNIIKIMGRQSYLSDQQSAITYTKVYPLNFVQANQMSTYLNSIRSLSGRRGNILVATDLNALIVTDTEEGLLQTERLIKEIDLKPQSVQIEAKVVDMELSDALDYGIIWQYAKSINRTSGDNVDRVRIGDMDPNDTTPIGGTSGAMPGSPATISLPPGGTAVSTLGLSLGRVTNSAFLTAQFSAAARKGKLKVLSNPKIVTLNGQQASIQAGSQVPTVQTTVSPGVGQTQSVSYLSVGILLRVTPTITPDGHVRMDIAPTVSQVGAGGIPGVAPAILTRTAQTTLIVKNEETAVIGGLITERKEQQTIKVPLLGDLPLVGWLFRRTSSDNPRTELLVFVTPTIIE